MITMINVGLVYENEKNIAKELQIVVSFLKKMGLIIVEWKISLDKDGEKWIKKKLKI